MNAEQPIGPPQKDNHSAAEFQRLHLINVPPTSSKAANDRETALPTNSQTILLPSFTTLEPAAAKVRHESSSPRTKDQGKAGGNTRGMRIQCVADSVTVREPEHEAARFLAPSRSLAGCMPFTVDSSFEDLANAHDVEGSRSKAAVSGIEDISTPRDEKCLPQSFFAHSTCRSSKWLIPAGSDHPSPIHTNLWGSYVRSVVALQAVATILAEGR